MGRRSLPPHVHPEPASAHLHADAEEADIPYICINLSIYLYIYWLMLAAHLRAGLYKEIINEGNNACTPMLKKPRAESGRPPPR